MTLGQRLAAVREFKDLKQVTVAAECGMHPSRLSRIENGHTQPTFAEVERLARFLGLKLDDLSSNRAGWEFRLFGRRRGGASA